MKYLLTILIVTNVFAGDDIQCSKKLRSLGSLKGELVQIDQHVSGLIVSAANRISGKALWTKSPAVMRLQMETYKASFTTDRVVLDVYFTDHGEVIGYTKSHEPSWCMKDT